MKRKLNWIFAPAALLLFLGLFTITYSLDDTSQWQDGVWVPMEADTFDAAHYDLQQQELTFRMRNDDIVKYERVPSVTFSYLLKANDPDWFLERHIKPRFNPLQLAVAP